MKRSRIKYSNGEQFEANLRASESGKYYTMDNLESFYNDAISNIELKIVKKKNKIPAYNISASFDTEFTTFQRFHGYGEELEDCGVMYLWGFGLNGLVLIGRTHEEYKTAMEFISQKMELGSNLNLIVYVHNLGADFQYIRKWYNWEEVFSLDERKPIVARNSLGICYKCSYVLTGTKLERVGKELTKYRVEKLDGSVDYSLIRHTKTPLTTDEIQYLVNDCLVVMAKIQCCIEEERSIHKIPLTKTGYIRRLCRNNCLYPKLEDGSADMSGHWKYRKLIEALTLKPEEYIQLKKAFAGGYTHANSWYVGELLENVRAFDLTSDYPSVIVTEKFPMSKGRKININNVSSREELDRYMKLYCCVFTVKFNDLESIIDYDHYISYSKAESIHGAIVDNGRIVDADSLTITITDVDFETISKCYSWSTMEISNMWVYNRGYLPTPFVNTVLLLYAKKTELKGIKGKEEEYKAAKELLNALYGMMVTDIARDNIMYDDDDWDHECPQYGDVIEQYNNSQSRFLSYAWGVYVTAYARKHLWMLILESKDDHVYSDTDNDKMMNADQHTHYIELWNQWLYKKLELATKYHGISMDKVMPKTIDGKEKLLGAWDDDGEYRYFKTLGAKRYMTQEGDVISITISGVNKGSAVPYMLDRHNIPYVQDKKNPLVYHITDPNADTRPVFDDFTEGMTFPGIYYKDDDNTEYSASGKLTHKYIDSEKSGKITDYLGNVADFHEYTALVLSPADYSMSISEEFKNFLNGTRNVR